MATAKKKADEGIVLAEEVTVRSINEGGAETRFSDGEGRLSLVHRHKTISKQLERGMIGRIVFIPSAEAMEAARVTVTVDASDTGSLPGSAEVVKE
jgi:hypothetical protein